MDRGSLVRYTPIITLIFGTLNQRAFVFVNQYDNLFFFFIVCFWILLSISIHSISYVIRQRLVATTATVNVILTATVTAYFNSFKSSERGVHTLLFVKKLIRCNSMVRNNVFERIRHKRLCFIRLIA